MLDNATKKRIDALRDILVGKIPDPKSQVEQITTGLIYKFMYDLDVESVEKGGIPSFFVGDYEKYSWKNLFDPKLGGADRVQLYSEAIEGMYTNPTAPRLFREIFKNSFLPFKDPSTLNMFLKEINGFRYSHSEKLGDAFEYLLSFMGSQGDAGQFRTPRHIIDFIVEIVNPQKNETILDPACGTAGFLISSYKHILSQNAGKNLGDQLSASDRKKLGDNLVGYDISPDMTRISLVNMYLHRFVSPKIHEYDSLSSEDRWNEYYDVILANPPFFSPKGGIQPHSRFGVQSTRAEVLFVDYIMEHLKPKGRAGIVVPEGIIFQTGNAYKTLRKKLVEDCLVGVISLPAGVFQPYSGVKTSILILDKEFNQKSDSIFFAKVENDGFSLGAQRTPTIENDLPKVIHNIQQFFDSGGEDASVLKLVTKEEISSTDFQLNSGTFESSSTFQVSSHKTVTLDEISEVITKGTTPKTIGYEFQNEGVSFLKVESISDNGRILPDKLSFVNFECHHSLKRSQLEEGDILFSIAGSLGRTAIVTKDVLPANTNQALAIIRLKDKTQTKFVYQCLGAKQLLDRIFENKVGVAQYNLSLKNIGDIEIPLPPIEVQQEIVDELEGYQKIIDGCRQVVENYKPTIDTDLSDFPLVKLREYADLKRGTTITKKQVEIGEIPVIAGGKKPAYFHSQSNRPANSITISSSGAYAGFVSFHPYPIFASDCLTVMSKEGRLDQRFLFHLLKSRQDNIYKMQTGSGQPHVYARDFDDFKIPLPPIEVQQEIVVELEGGQKIIDGNKKFIDLYTQKIQDRISKVWGE